jgi:hypothetical protein
MLSLWTIWFGQCMHLWAIVGYFQDAANPKKPGKVGHSWQTGFVRWQAHIYRFS